MAVPDSVMCQEFESSAKLRSTTQMTLASKGTCYHARSVLCKSLLILAEFHTERKAAEIIQKSVYHHSQIQAFSNHEHFATFALSVSIGR